MSTQKQKPRRQSETSALNGLARRIKQEDAAANRGAFHARNAGNLLIKVKERLPHGEFMVWVKQHCGIAHSTANLYMFIAREWPTIAESHRDRNLSLWEAVALLREKPRTWKKAGGESESHPPLVVDQCLDEIRRFIGALERARQMADRLRPHADHIRAKLVQVQEALARLETELAPAVAA
jgi:hypothetical protein